MKDKTKIYTVKVFLRSTRANKQSEIQEQRRKRIKSRSDFCSAHTSWPSVCRCIQNIHNLQDTKMSFMCCEALRRHKNFEVKREKNF